MCEIVELLWINATIINEKQYNILTKPHLYTNIEPKICGVPYHKRAKQRGLIG
jgi:hypothetical protein